MSVIHDEVKDLLKEVQGEVKGLEDVTGHDLMRLRDGLAAALHAIKAARVGQDVNPPETNAGEGARATGAGELHPEAAASEPREETAEQMEARAAKEPDPVVREKIRAGAESARQASEQAGTSKASK